MNAAPALYRPANHPSEVRRNTDNDDEMTNGTVLGPALVAAWLSALHRLPRGGAMRLRRRDIRALLDRRDVLVHDTETTGVGSTAEVVEVVAIDTTGTLRLVEHTDKATLQGFIGIPHARRDHLHR